MDHAQRRQVVFEIADGRQRDKQDMGKVTFRKIADSLRCGREIEFSYKNKQYSITTSHGYWNFCCDNNLIERVCPFDDKETLVKFVKSYCIEGTPIPMIFDEERYDASSVCIL